MKAGEFRYYSRYYALGFWATTLVVEEEILLVEELISLLILQIGAFSAPDDTAAAWQSPSLHVLGPLLRLLMLLQLLLEHCGLFLGTQQFRVLAESEIYWIWKLMHKAIDIILERGG